MEALFVGHVSGRARGSPGEHVSIPVLMEALFVAGQACGGGQLQGVVSIPVLMEALFVAPPPQQRAAASWLCFNPCSDGSALCRAPLVRVQTLGQGRVSIPV